MRTFLAVFVLAFVLILLSAGKSADNNGTIAEVYYWKAKAEKLEEYNRYIRDYAAPIDGEARRRGAFISVTTYVSGKPDSPWTHMRVFVLRDQKQQEGLEKALDDAKLRLHSDEQERNH